MQTCIIKPFETIEKRFLRLVTESLNALKNTPQKSRIILQYLLDLSIDYIEILPQHFFELFYWLKDLINNYSYYEHIPSQLNQEIDRIILLCSLLQEKPTVDLFKKMIENYFETIYEYMDFPESVLLSIIDSIKESSNDLKESNYAKNRLYWLALSNMNLPKNVLLCVIEHFYLKGDDFINFCKDLAVSQNSDEDVLLALINRIEKQKISSKARSNNLLKTNLYITILLTALPTNEVVKKVIKIIYLENKMYYSFFYMLILEFGESKEILETIIERLNLDEPKKPENIKVFIRRLRILAMNF